MASQGKRKGKGKGKGPSRPDWWWDSLPEKWNECFQCQRCEEAGEQLRYCSECEVAFLCNQNCVRGHFRDALELEGHFYVGQGVPSSYAECVPLFRGLPGNHIAQLCLGVCYEYGMGVAEDYKEARRLYMLATKPYPGHPSAVESLQRLDAFIKQKCPLLDKPVVIRDRAQTIIRNRASSFSQKRHNTPFTQAF